MRLTRGVREVLLAGVALAALLPAHAGPAGEAQTLMPHLARYALSLSPASRGGEVAALQGRLEVRFAASCDGWQIRQSMGFRMLGQDGTELEHLAHFDAFEEHDGSGFVFNMRTWEDRELVEELAGSARRGPGAVHVRYSRPQARDEELPADTLFPGQHLHRLLAAARAGRRVVMYTVFDGSSAQNPFQISAAIGARRAPAAGAPAGLAGRASWPARLAYFDLDAVELRSEFEMSVALYDNGVAGDMVYDYGDFAIDVKLTELEMLPRRECR